MIYYDGLNVLKVVKCNFKGKLAKGINYIDGEINNKNLPSILIDDCIFEYNKIKKKWIISSSLSSNKFIDKYFNMIFISIGIYVDVSLVELVLNYMNFHNKYLNDDKLTNEKQNVNDSL